MTYSKLIFAILFLITSFLLFNGCYTTMGMAHPNDVVVEEQIEVKSGHIVVRQYVWEDPDEWDLWPEVHVVQVYPAWPIFYDPDLYLMAGYHWAHVSWHKPWRHHYWPRYRSPNWHWYGHGYHNYHAYPHHPVIVYHKYHRYDNHWRGWSKGHCIYKNPGNRRDFDRQSHTITSRSRKKTVHSRNAATRRRETIQKKPRSDRQAREYASVSGRRQSTIQKSPVKVQNSRNRQIKNVRRKESKVVHRPQKQIQSKPSENRRRNQSASAKIKEDKSIRKQAASVKKQSRKKSGSVRKQVSSKKKSARIASSNQKKSVPKVSRSQSASSGRSKSRSNHGAGKKKPSDKKSRRSRR